MIFQKSIFFFNLQCFFFIFQPKAFFKMFSWKPSLRFFIYLNESRGYTNSRPSDDAIIVISICWNNQYLFLYISRVHSAAESLLLVSPFNHGISAVVLVGCIDCLRGWNIMFIGFVYVAPPCSPNTSSWYFPLIYKNMKNIWILSRLLRIP